MQETGEELDNGKDNHQKAEGSSGCQTQEGAGSVQTIQRNKGTEFYPKEH